MFKKLLTVGVALAAISMSACSTTGPKPDQGIAQTSDYVLDVYTGLGADMSVNPDRPLSYTEARGISNIDAHCVGVTHRVDSSLGPMFKDGVTLGLLEGLGTAIGALAFPGSNFRQYFEYAAGAGAGGGAATGKITHDQIMGIVHSYCVLQWVGAGSTHHDSRLADLIVIPAPTLHAKGLSVAPRGASDDQAAADFRERQASRADAKHEDEKTSSDLTPPPPPPL